MGKINKTPTCYYCGAPATSREHVPPKIFRKGVAGIEQYEAITVPSCSVHNEAKHKIDQAAYNAFALPIQSINGSSMQLSHEQVNTMVREKCESFLHQQDLTIAVSLRGPELGKNEVSLAHTLVDWMMWVRMLTAGQLFIIHNQQRPNIDWESCVVFNWDFVPGIRTAELRTANIVDVLGSNELMYRELSVADWCSATEVGSVSTPEFSYTFRIGKTQAVWTMEHKFLSQYRIWCSMKLTPEAEGVLVSALQKRKNETHLKKAKREQKKK